mmetsp:Transcript_24044/g.42425  ORF Transcript_24044/g.42425 Transcript_24044/m.42425 type:complete len:211 (-) Transcript_24044:80-712(-)
MVFPEPQLKRSPSFERAVVTPPPHETDATLTPLMSPSTTVGDRHLPPSPALCPRNGPCLPHVSTRPSSVATAECTRPHDACTTSWFSNASTTQGLASTYCPVSTLGLTSPRPSWPSSPVPQAYTVEENVLLELLSARRAPVFTVAVSILAGATSQRAVSGHQNGSKNRRIYPSKPGSKILSLTIRSITTPPHRRASDSPSTPLHAVAPSL